jgi:dTDP-4-dehydrorhamnose reductase
LPYIENDRVTLTKNLGAPKTFAEDVVLSYCPDALIIRTSASLSPSNETSCSQSVIHDLKSNQMLRTACEKTLSPTCIPQLIDAALDLFIDGETGVWQTRWGMRQPSNREVVTTEGVLVVSVDESIGDYLQELKAK